MKTKNSRNSNLNGNEDSTLLYTGTVVDMGGYDFGELGIEFSDQRDTNLRGVLEDLISMSYGNIGDIKIRDDSASPEGSSQVDLMKISITGSNVAPYSTKIMFFGKILNIDEGETLTAIKQKMLDIFTDYRDENLFFSDAKYDDSNNIVITYKDTRKHNTIDMIPFPHFMSFEIETLYENRYGAGKWEFIGTKTETLGGEDVNLNYYKRVG